MTIKMSTRRNPYVSLITDDKRRRERNVRLLSKLENIEKKAAFLQAKTDRIRSLKSIYKSQFHKVPCAISSNFMTHEFIPGERMPTNSLYNMYNENNFQTRHNINERVFNSQPPPCHIVKNITLEEAIEEISKRFVLIPKSTYKRVEEIGKEKPPSGSPSVNFDLQNLNLKSRESDQIKSVPSRIDMEVEDFNNSKIETINPQSSMMNDPIEEDDNVSLKELNYNNSDIHDNNVSVKNENKDNLSEKEIKIENDHSINNENKDDKSEKDIKKEHPSEVFNEKFSYSDRNDTLNTNINEIVDEKSKKDILSSLKVEIAHVDQMGTDLHVGIDENYDTMNAMSARVDEDKQDTEELLNKIDAISNDKEDVKTSDEILEDNLNNLIDNAENELSGLSVAQEDVNYTTDEIPNNIDTVENSAEINLNQNYEYTDGQYHGDEQNIQYEDPNIENTIENENYTYNNEDGTYQGTDEYVNPENQFYDQGALQNNEQSQDQPQIEYDQNYQEGNEGQENLDNQYEYQNETETPYDTQYEQTGEPNPNENVETYNENPNENVETYNENPNENVEMYNEQDNTGYNTQDNYPEYTEEQQNEYNPEEQNAYYEQDTNSQYYDEAAINEQTLNDETAIDNKNAPLSEDVVNENGTIKPLQILDSDTDQISNKEEMSVQESDFDFSTQ